MSTKKDRKPDDQVINQQIQTLSAEAEEAKERINAAKAQVWKQQLEYERYEKLYEQKSTTAQQLEQVKATPFDTRAGLLEYPPR